MKKEKQASKFDLVYQFKITLNDVSPKIWRRILVSKNYSFFDLSCAILNAMGWFGGHMHGYYISPKGDAVPTFIQLPSSIDDSWGGCEEKLDERKEKIADYFGKEFKQCQFTYDFGDSWDHTILFERELSRDNKLEYPICLAGKNACPPEDCGSIPGYIDLQRILKNSKDPEYREMCDWLGIDEGKEFDSSEFNLDEVFFEDSNEALKEWEEEYKNIS